MDLHIDTTEQGKIKLQILDDGRVVAKFQKQTQKISESLLLEIEKLLKKSNLKLDQISKVSVNPGPGGFSSTRTGVATANALNFAFGRDLVVLPKYDKEPNITQPRLAYTARQAQPKK